MPQSSWLVELNGVRVRINRISKGRCLVICQDFVTARVDILYAPKILSTVGESANSTSPSNQGRLTMRLVP